jgi:hypothetical protein
MSGGIYNRQVHVVAYAGKENITFLLFWLFLSERGISLGEELRFASALLPGYELAHGVFYTNTRHAEHYFTYYANENKLGRGLRLEDL